MVRVYLRYLLICLASLGLAAELEAKDNTSVQLTSWQVPWDNTRPRDPAVDSKGDVWFCGQAGDYIAKLTPSTGEFTRYAIPEGTHPHNLIVDDKDRIWYAGNKNAHIGMLDPTSGDITQYPMPDDEASDPHTLIFDQTGNIWFTVQWGNFVGYLQTDSGEVTLYPVETLRARPYGIKIDSNNQPWIVLLGSNKLATVKADKLVEIDLPHQDARPRRLEISPDGHIWYADYARGYLGSYQPSNQAFDEWAMPGGDKSLPYATAMDKQGRIWLSETGSLPNQWVGFDPKTKTFVANVAVKEGGHIRHTYVTPDTGEIWFGTDSGYIVKATTNSK